MSVRKIVPIEKAAWDVAPAPEWVVENEPDWNFKVPNTEEYALAILLLDEQRLVATHASYSRTVRQLLTHGAVQSLSQASIDFDPAAFKLWLHELAVWRKDAQGVWQKRSHAQKENLLLRQREQQLEQQMLHGRVSVMALLEDVRVGDAIDMAYTLEPTDPLPGWRFTEIFGWGWSLPNARTHFRLQLDPAQKLTWRIHLPPFGAAQPTEEATPECVTWRMGPATPIQPEPNAPGSSWPLALLDISGWESWGDVARFVMNLWKDAYHEGAEAVAEEAARLRVEGDPSATARAVIRFVQEEIRYLAIDFGHGGGVLPNGAGTVLRRRFGDCKDKAVLLTAMLRCVGIEAAPVLVAPTWREGLDRLLPSTGAFSHAIVVVTVGELRRFVDPTTVGQGGDFEHLVQPNYRRGLVLREETEALETLPELQRAELKVIEIFDLRGREPGSVEIVLQATGHIADSLRAAVLQQGLSAFVKGGATRLQNHFPALQPQLGTATVNDEFAINRIRVAATHTLPTWGRPGEKPPGYFRYGAHGLFLIVEGLGGPQVRKQPWVLPFPVLVHHRVVVRGRGVQRVRAQRWGHVGPGFKYRLDLTGVRRENTFDYQWETTQPEIAPEDWPKYGRERETALNRAGANVPVLLGVRSWVGDGNNVPARGVGAIIGIAVIIVVNVVRLGVNSSAPPRPAPSNLSSYQPARSTASESSLESARETLARGEYASAAEKLKAIRTRFSADLQYHLARAEACLGSRQLEQARAALQDARKIERNNAETDALDAELQALLGDLPAARELAERAYARKPDAFSSRLRLGQVALRLGDDARGRGLLESLVNRRPPNAQAALAYGLWLWHHGEQQLAETVMNTATVINAESRTAGTEAVRAQYLAATGRAGDAVMPARRGMDRAPNEVTAVYRVVVALLRAGRKAEAVMETRQMIRKFPDAPLSWAAASAVSSASGRNSLDDAERSFQRWRELAPGDPMPQAAYAVHLLAYQRADDARKLLETAVAQTPHAGLLWGTYAAVLESLGESKAAADAKAKADRLLPDRETATLLY